MKETNLRVLCQTSDKEIEIRCFKNLLKTINSLENKKAARRGNWELGQSKKRGWLRATKTGDMTRMGRRAGRGHGEGEVADQVVFMDSWDNEKWEHEGELGWGCGQTRPPRGGWAGRGERETEAPRARRASPRVFRENILELYMFIITGRAEAGGKEGSGPTWPVHGSDQCSSATRVPSSQKGVGRVGSW